MSMLDSIVNETIKTMPHATSVADHINVDSVEQNGDEKIKVNKPDKYDTPNSNLFGEPVSDKKSDPYMTDKEGTVFNSDIHITDELGKPRYNKNGSFRKKRGPKTGSQNSINDTNKQQAAYQAGKVTAESIFMVGTAFGGPEWSPIIDTENNINESDYMTEAWARYYFETGKTDLPPWAGVAMAMGAYVLPRLTMPQTRTKLQRMKDWIKVKLFNRKMAKQKKS